jgi:hypothetical protein
MRSHEPKGVGVGTRELPVLAMVIRAGGQAETIIEIDP